MVNNQKFLADLRPLEYNQRGWNPMDVFIGKGENGIEVLVADVNVVPNKSDILKIWKARRAGRATPVLAVVLHKNNVMICGASGDSPPIIPLSDRDQVERLCREILNQPDRHSALQFLSQALSSLDTNLPGINNSGFVALHELLYGVKKRKDWKAAGAKASKTVNLQDKDFLQALGYKIERLDNLTDLLISDTRRTALAVTLHENEIPEAGSDRFNSLSPVNYALAKADSENLPYVIVVQGNRLRLYATSVDVGVGRRGRTETFIDCQPSLLSGQDLAYVWLLYSAEALAVEGSLSEILDGSHRFAGNLAKQLRERIYEKVMPVLAQGIATARNIDRPDQKELKRTYEMASTVLFRLLFVAYAEDRDLLPYRFNDGYRRRSLKNKAQEFAKYIQEETPISVGDSHWQEISVLWKAIAVGNTELGIPAYDGGLFSEDPSVSNVGADIAKLTLPNSVFEEALRALLVIETDERILGPVDFRSLGVREFGTIYEGLLESELALAETDLTIDKKGIFTPAKNDKYVEVKEGGIYLHNRSGIRKASGSYYTKSFAVEHLLNNALEPALTNHFKRLEKMDDAEAAEAFFDFRVADIAMGSGHFLISAIDRIEKRMADFLTKRKILGVYQELSELRSSAMSELGDLAETMIIEDGQLLRRLIARRCIYGVDLNALSVQLAKLSVWIHTFVPGLPLSMLDHTMVHGNSLVGIGTINDVQKKLKEASDTVSLYAVDVDSLLGAAAAPLRRLGKINDATLKDINAARQARKEAKEAISSTEALCDLITARSISTDEKVIGFQLEEWDKRKDDLETVEIIRTARKDLEGLDVLHFPVAFPEVFLRDRSGFDVILGNPPWDKIKVDEHVFWSRHFPGYRSLPQRQREKEESRWRNERPDLVSIYETEVADMKKMRQILVNDPAYLGMGTGDPESYKAFCWRFWRLTVAEGGAIGVVLPRVAFSAQGSTEFRLAIFKESESVSITTLLNNRKWVFDDIDPRYTTALVCIVRGTPKEKSIFLLGPYSCLEDFKETESLDCPTAVFDFNEVFSWNDSVSVPSLPSKNLTESAEILTQIRKSPRLDLAKEGTWRARPDRELDATNQKNLMDLKNKECPSGYWPVYKGESFGLWNSDTGTYYAWANPEPVIEWLQNKRVRARNNRKSAHHEFCQQHLSDKKTLPCWFPRIAFRDITNSTNQRTIITCLIPPKVFITNTAPYFLWPCGDEKDQTFLLGVLSSIPFDWYTRRFVELHANFFLMNSFPIPRPGRDNSLWNQIVELAGTLACSDDRYAKWAEAIGVSVGKIPEDEKEDMIYELDAVVAHLYGLNQRQLVHIFETFHVGWDYQHRLEGVLSHYQRWMKNT